MSEARGNEAVGRSTVVEGWIEFEVESEWNGMGEGVFEYRVVLVWGVGGTGRQAPAFSFSALGKMRKKIKYKNAP